MIVYWIFDETCSDPIKNGYVGITNNVTKRFYQHKNARRFPHNIQIIQLFEGTKEECKIEERKLRPDQHIGWNRAKGGGAYYSGPKSDKTRLKMSLAKKGKKFSDEHRQKINLTIQEQPRTHSIDTRQRMSLAKLGRKRQPFSAETRLKMSLSQKGRPKSEKHRENISKGRIRNVRNLNTTE